RPLCYHYTSPPGPAFVRLFWPPSRSVGWKLGCTCVPRSHLAVAKGTAGWSRPSHGSLGVLGVACEALPRLRHAPPTYAGVAPRYAKTGCRPGALDAAAGLSTEPQLRVGGSPANRWHGLGDLRYGLVVTRVRLAIRGVIPSTSEVSPDGASVV